MRLFRTLIVCFFVTLYQGCKPTEEIRVYSVPRSSPPGKPLDASEVASLLDHTLAAIVPQDDKAWFFKLTGRAPAIGRQRDAFVQFLATVVLAENNSETPSWQIPEGWQEKPASEMRLATLVVPDEEGPLEVAISSLPYAGDWKTFLVPNVNRWLRQLEEPPLDESTILKLVKEVKLQNGTATTIELVGLAPKQSSGDPHAGVVGAPPLDNAGPPPAPTSNTALEYDTPSGWSPGRTSEMRKAAFRIVEGESQAEVTVIDLPASGGSQVTDVAANMARWAGQVGLTELGAEGLQKLIEPVTVDGAKGSYAELVSPATAERPLAMLVAMVVHNEKVWFFKMSGEVGLVQAQREAFRSFLASVKFGEN
ncbi:MAG: hypothetical protein KDA57_07865 [Planctomycetales bacterium]|nr:hypothetical protein [Planctomycetales bacterium]